MPLMRSSSSSHRPARPTLMDETSDRAGRGGAGRPGRHPGSRRGERLVSFLSGFEAPAATSWEPNLTARELLMAVYQMPGADQAGQTSLRPGPAR